MINNKVLEVSNLTVTIGTRRVIDNVNFELHAGKVLALVGESGSGKTMTALSILDLLPRTARREKGEANFKGKNIFGFTSGEIRDLRGNKIAMVFQEPTSALNPVMRIGDQISEAIITHKISSRRDAHGKVEELLKQVLLPPGAARSYPHELSGGMRQRAVLAMALSCSPEILILDEPTTALDVTIQKQMLDLIASIQKEKHLSILFITHDFSVVNMVADEVCVMRSGVVVERGLKDEILRNPQHGYTRHLINCVPRLGDKRKRLPIE